MVLNATLWDCFPHQASFDIIKDHNIRLLVVSQNACSGLLSQFTAMIEGLVKGGAPGPIGLSTRLVEPERTACLDHILLKIFSSDNSVTRL